MSGEWEYHETSADPDDYCPAAGVRLTVIGDELEIGLAWDGGERMVIRAGLEDVLRSLRGETVADPKPVYEVWE